MVQQIYAVYDNRAELYNTPFFMHNDRMALRAFADLVNDERSQVHRHREDFKLVHLGEINLNDGIITVSLSTIAHATDIPTNNITPPALEVVK